ncbi:TFP11-domain-containing protein [Auriculariales sp. MPI-PUGE-AT-0066]|nr:TFP11-domain-containing protein [Auriculariales sp. MPI-PUGE-AT-0066]
MARRKRDFLQDDDSSGSDGSDDGDAHEDLDNDPDARAERELFTNPYGRKRKRTDDAIYGIFADSDEDDAQEVRNRRKRKDISKAPVFTSSTKLDTKLDTDNKLDADDKMEDDGAETDIVDDDSSDDDDAPAPSRAREDSEDEAESKPRFGGLGMGGIASASAFARGGIGATPADNSPSSEPTEPARTAPGSTRMDIDDSPAFPSVIWKVFNGFGTAQESSGSRPATPSISSFGARLMAKMGWESGTGLGASGEGMVTPVETKLRPTKMGIAFKGFKERTDQAKTEAKRRGEDISDDETNRKKSKKPVDRSAAWKEKPNAGPSKRKSRARKVEHKTYEQILEEAGAEGTPQQQQQQIIIDATGAGGPREITSLSEMASWTPSADMRIPEVRHNLRLIVDMCKGELDGLAKEARALQERKRGLRKRLAEDAQLIARLQNIHLVIDNVSTKAQEANSAYELKLDIFTADFTRLAGEFPKEFAAYCLDQIVVAAFAPALRRTIMSWQPLQDPEAHELTTLLVQWLPALKMTVPEPPSNELDVYGMPTNTKPVIAPTDKPMTAYDSFLWNAWMPRVRSALNNEWAPDNAAPAVKLYESWLQLIPPFVRDSLLDQVILPKIQKAVADWSGRSTVSLRSVVYPWLPHVGPARMEDLLGDARRKVKAGFRAWKVADDLPMELLSWKEMFPKAEWENLLLKYVVPKLGATLREDLRIDPRNQPPLDPLHRTLAWRGHLRPALLDALLQTGFFPKWLDVLHKWLTHPTANYAQIADWYKHWKDEILRADVPEIKRGLDAGLKLMGDAMALGNDTVARAKLPKPDYGHISPSTSRATSPSALSSAQRGSKPPVPSSRTTEITFRSLVEEHAAAHDLLVLPTQRVHELSRKPLLRVSRNVEGRGGLVVYILDDAVWTAPDGGGDNVPWRAITMDEMVVLASKKP